MFSAGNGFAVSVTLCFSADYKLELQPVKPVAALDSVAQAKIVFTCKIKEFMPAKFLFFFLKRGTWGKTQNNNIIILKSLWCLYSVLGGGGGGIISLQLNQNPQ